MVENSQNSHEPTPKGRRRITETKPLTLEQWLEILGQVLYEVERASEQQADVETAGQGVVTIRLHGVAYDDGLLVPFIDTNPVQGGNK